MTAATNKDAGEVSEAVKRLEERVGQPGNFTIPDEGAIRTLLGAIAAAQARENALQASLEPFGHLAADEGVEDYPDDKPTTVTIGRHTAYYLTLGHFRAAAAAINPS